MVVYHSVRDGEVHLVREGEEVWVPLIDDSTLKIQETAPDWLPRIAERKGYDVEIEDAPDANKPKPADA